MGCLKVTAILALLLAPWPARADVGRWKPYIDEASARFAIPADWIERVMEAESGGRTSFGGRPITSRAGAMGLMQVMPATWAELAPRLGLGPNPHDPRDNILAGSAYLRLMYDRFGYPGLFGAYNAGPGRFEEYRQGRRQLPAETRTYLARLALADWAHPVGTSSAGGSSYPGSSLAGRKRADPNSAPIFVALNETR